MHDKLPEPLVPSEVDLRGLPYTPIFRGRLFGSEFHAKVSDAGWRAGVTLWLKSWDQMPAGTLPLGDVELARLAEFGRDVKSWLKVKEEALWGWLHCSDGRMHHKTVAEGVIEAWKIRLAQRDRTAKARAARSSKSTPQNSDNGNTNQTTDVVTCSVTEKVTDTAKQMLQHPREGKGREGNINSSESSSDEPGAGPPPTSFDADLVRRIRVAMGEEPVIATGALPVPILNLLDQGKTDGSIIEDDVFVGIRTMFERGDAEFRVTRYSQVVGWIRGAAKDRLTASPRRSASGSPTKSTVATVYVSGVGDIPRSSVEETVEAWHRGEPYYELWGPEPDKPGCALPREFRGPRRCGQTSSGAVH